QLPPGQGETRWRVSRNPRFHAWLARWTRRAAETEDVDLVHAQHKGAVVGAQRAARALGVPFAGTVRDVGLLCPVGAPLGSDWATVAWSTAQYVTRCVPYYLAHYAKGDRFLRRARHWASLLATRIDHTAKRRALAAADLVIAVSRGILDVHPPDLVDRTR